jgi:hypothetical protein
LHGTPRVLVVALDFREHLLAAGWVEALGRDH